MSGKLIVIVAPSGTGKSSLIKRLKNDFPEIEESVSCTTRPIRPGEQDGESYNFLSVEEFEKKISLNEFLEYAKVHSNYYGTRKSVVDQGLKEGKILLFDLDVQGCDSMKKAYPEAKIIFIEPPSIEVLEERLRGRGTERPEVIEERLQNAKNELQRKDDFDFLVMNDDFDKAFERLKEVTSKIINEREGI